MKQRRMGRGDSICPDTEVWKCMTCHVKADQRGVRGRPGVKGLIGEEFEAVKGHWRILSS